MKQFSHGLSTKHLNILHRALLPFAEQIELVGLFGSRATGVYRSNSDIDLVIYGLINEKTVDRIFTLLNDCNLPVKVDVQAYNLIANASLKSHIDSKMLLLFTQEQLKGRYKMRNKMTNTNEENIKDLLVIDNTNIPIQFCIQNWGLPFDRELLKKAIKIVFTSDSLDILTIDKIDVSLELVKYSADKSPTGMENIDGRLRSENGTINTVVMSDRFIYTMENVVIKVTFQNQEVKSFAITSSLSDDMPLNHVGYSKL